MTRSAAALLALSLLSPATLFAQVAPAPLVAPPMLPILTSYQYWPVQFVQFVGDELPYSMIMLKVIPGKHPLLEVVLTERAGGKRIHYTDNDMLLASASGSGDEAHKVALAYEPADTETVGSVTSVRFTLPDGRPLQWRFVQGSDISEQGSGLNPFPGTSIPIFAYREQGAVAGEGTALQVGDVVSTAAVWTEISHPPYFIGYHGAETQSSHTLVFVPGKETWTVKSAPATLATGATWELDSDHGNHRSLHIDKVEGAKLTVTSTDRFQPGVHCTLSAERVGESWSIESARFAPDHDGDKHWLTVQFARPLSMPADHVPVTLTAGRKTTLATATFSAGATNGSSVLSFASPAWLNGKTMTETVTTGDQAITLTAHP